MRKIKTLYEIWGADGFENVFDKFSKAKREVELLRKITNENYEIRKLRRGIVC